MINEITHSITRIHFDPFLGWEWIVLLAGLSIVVLITALFQRRKGSLLRVLTIAVFLLALCNPSLLQQERMPVKDVAVVLHDQSLSQNMGTRQERSKKALAQVKEKLAALDNIEARFVTAPNDALLSPETLVNDALAQAFSDVPQDRRAGVILITDGQVHDAQNVLKNAQDYGRFNVLVSGDQDERDRRIDVIQSPSYGIVGDSIKLTYKVSQTDNIAHGSAEVKFNRFDGNPQIFDVPVGVEQELDVFLDHAGENIFELSVDGVKDEITLANNRAAIRINGVRDRLKVLLVSGKPHAGGRTWRDLLTSDPGVDLVHFTILREPEKLDATPQRELALIAFPFRELFEIKLYEFDLIVFDRYELNRILPRHYFDNIATYVKNGGALLEASGPSFAGEDSIYYTDIGTILPASPNGDVISAVFKPQLSDTGRAHPVTENLDPLGNKTSKPNWGSWLRQVSLKTIRGDTLMTGYQDQPLLILDRVDQGRVAQIGSDHIWLWSRGFQGGGPHAELLRRTVHWLMKEPELDERALKIHVNDNEIRVRSRDTQTDQMKLTMTKPDGLDEEIILKRGENGFLEKIILADQLGIYAFSDGDAQKRFITIGEENPPELRDVLASEEKLSPIVEATSGSLIWLDVLQEPKISFARGVGVKSFLSEDTIFLQSNNAFDVKAVKSQPLMPSWLWLFVFAGFLGFAWWREGRA